MKVEPVYEFVNARQQVSLSRLSRPQDYDSWVDLWSLSLYTLYLNSMQYIAISTLL